AGLRAGLFFPRHRLEIGFSEQHVLQDARVNRLGSYLEWQPARVPFDLRAEGTYSREEGNGLWVEGAYRFRNAPASLSAVRRSSDEPRYFTRGRLPESIRIFRISTQNELSLE